MHPEDAGAINRTLSEISRQLKRIADAKNALRLRRAVWETSEKHGVTGGEGWFHRWVSDNDGNTWAVVETDLGYIVEVLICKAVLFQFLKPHSDSKM